MFAPLSIGMIFAELMDPLKFPRKEYMYSFLLSTSRLRNLAFIAASILRLAIEFVYVSFTSFDKVAEHPSMGNDF